MRFVLLLGVTLLVSADAHAEDMAPLESVLQGNPEESYAFVRCAGFYRANVFWAGDAVDQAAVDAHMEAVTALLYVGAVIRSNKTGEELESVFPAVQADFSAIIELYAENFRQSYALRGAAWDGNPLWEADSATCKLFGDAALQATADELEGSKP